MKKVVVVGKGGREHALAAKLRESSEVSELWVCPGNPGMQKMGIQCAPVESPADIEAFCLENKVSLVVVGPEAAILSDLKSRLESKNVPVFAPTPNVAKLESSKAFCKEVLEKSGVLTAHWSLAQNNEDALKEIHAHDFSSPIVVKADGLAAGKGVWVCESLAKAEEAVDVLGSQYGYPLLIEECLIGKELSAFALCDGKDFVVLGTACDYKRITPDPFSANTGGMGAYSPCDFISAEDDKTIHETFAKTLNYLSSQGTPFQGFLFAGLMKTAKGLYVLEYNVRMGDPETQSLMPRLKSDLVKIITAAVQHELKNQTCELSSLTSVHVVAVSQGYPQSQMILGNPVTYPTQETKSRLYFAGVGEKAGQIVNTGGRVLGMTALAASKEEARKQAYEDLKKVSYEGMYFREDIGL
ncbi:phosphoribosylamine--glycine ligase [Bdellovibrio bacteriovorus]|uniref:phosphoribosylamine--glycine ligase n=1 Tax=Bdellovibrio bacteriovorus TaxID=959 RepID=A0A150WNP3_BDEBC|nr:phosphoribosylamine--glycine ligase [Bdellovibrio bacteriovorus]KYG65927.1 phosphoribosylamine--glycine ligase [Bdellovibrio bacteriovorus]